MGTTFQCFNEASKAAQAFARAALLHQTKRQKNTYFYCFRSGACKASVAPEDRKRKKYSIKCDCKFQINMVQNENKMFVVTKINSEHNHMLYQPEEVAELPQNRFIPEEVQATVKDLLGKGRYLTNEIDLQAREYHKDIAVTWSKRDMQNLIDKLKDAGNETNVFLEMLMEKQNENSGWIVYKSQHPITTRLEKVFWMSLRGRLMFQEFSDVVEIDATYKTNRFNMPLVLVTGIDREGITFLICGCLLSDEKLDSYLWVLERLKQATNTEPSLMFSDGDQNIATAIERVFPNTVHLLCRFHIGQNIHKNLAAKLQNGMKEFMEQFGGLLQWNQFLCFTLKWKLSLHAGPRAARTWTIFSGTK